jgi:hypothetical protein
MDKGDASNFVEPLTTESTTSQLKFSSEETGLALAVADERVLNN